MYGWYDMATHMKTTVEISDALLAAAKQVATREKTTVRSLIEEGLRYVVSRRGRSKYRLRDASVPGKGLHPDLEGMSWDAIRDRIYERHT
jgi:elongation factor P--beta-lysine ligase